MDIHILGSYEVAHTQQPWRRMLDRLWPEALRSGAGVALHEPLLAVLFDDGDNTSLLWATSPDTTLALEMGQSCLPFSEEEQRQIITLLL